ncbi:DUF4835 family protein [Chitinophagaceae bacterium MMS25-I14]
MYRKIFSLLFLLAAFGRQVSAQELNCKVKVMHEKITGTDPQVFTTLERAVTEFLNTRKWTSDEFQTVERIDVNVLINLTGKMGGDDDGYQATLNIQASRPVYNSGYTSPLINYIDRDFVFHYSQYNPLQFDDNRINGADALESNLTAVLAYYVYLVIGLDYDSFAPNGGSVYLKKAQNIVNNAPESGKLIAGWKAFEDKRNRYWLIDQILSPRFQSLRTYWYSLHREGFDNMYAKPAEARQKIVAGIGGLSQLNKDNPGSILVQFFFNAKSDELLRVLYQLPREDRGVYANLLSQMDVPNAAKYNNLK